MKNNTYPSTFTAQVKELIERQRERLQRERQAQLQDFLAKNEPIRNQERKLLGVEPYNRRR
mgnify:CR=1 FL=1